MQKAQADTLIAEAGGVDLAQVAAKNKQLSHVVWVAKIGSRHMDWNDVPKEVEGRLDVAVWHELVDEKKELTGLEVPEWDPNSQSPPLSTLWGEEFVEYGPEVSFSIYIC